MLWRGRLCPGAVQGIVVGREENPQKRAQTATRRPAVLYSYTGGSSRVRLFFLQGRLSKRGDITVNRLSGAGPRVGRLKAQGQSRGCFKVDLAYMEEEMLWSAGICNLLVQSTSVGVAG